jgi:purine-binding chemotaxis protein CheW
MLDDSGPPRPKITKPQDLAAEVDRLFGNADHIRHPADPTLPDPPPFTDADGPGPAQPEPELLELPPASAAPLAFDHPEELTEGLLQAAEPVFEERVLSEPTPPGPALEEVIGDIDDAYAALGVGETIAREPVPRDATSLLEKFVLFSLGPSTFAVPTRNVREVERAPEVTTVPGVPSWLRGVTNLRGDILSVVDLRAFFAVPADEEARRMLVVASDSGEVVTALLVDAVRGMTRLTAADRRPATAVSDERIAPFVDGLAELDGRLVTVLDLDRILRAPDFAQFQGA